MMAREIKLAKIADYMEGQVERLLRATVEETDARLKEGSPVDTGRLRISWKVGENANNSTPAPPNDYRGTPAPLKGFNYTAGQEKLGNYYSIHNNLPYAEPVIYGTSLPRSWNGQWRVKDDQIVKSYPDLISKEMRAYVRSQYEKIKRQG